MSSTTLSLKIIRYFSCPNCYEEIYGGMSVKLQQQQEKIKSKISVFPEKSLYWKMLWRYRVFVKHKVVANTLANILSYSMIKKD